MNSTAQLARDPQAHLPTGPPLKTSRLKIVSHGGSGRVRHGPSNERARGCVVADVTYRPRYRVGIFMARNMRATPSHPTSAGTWSRDGNHLLANWFQAGRQSLQPVSELVARRAGHGAADSRSLREANSANR